MTLLAANRIEAGTLERLDNLLINGLVAASLFYTLLFNVLPDGPRSSIGGVLGLVVVGRCLLSRPQPAAKATTILFIALAMIIAFYYIFVMDPRDQSGEHYAEISFRLLTGFAILQVFAFAPNVISPLLLLVTCVTVSVFGVFVAVTGDPVIYAELARPATFTGGPIGVHSTSYVMTAAFLGWVTLWRAGYIGPRLTLAFALPLLVTIIFYYVRTCWVMLLSYLLVSLMIHLRSSARPGHWLALPVMLSLGIAAFFASSSMIDYSSFSSGRSEVYAERLEMIAERDPMKLLFGTGTGSELMASSVWWWAKKNSHNDFIDFAIQVGIVGLAVTMAMMFLSSLHLGKLQLPIFLSFVASSAVSNGLIGRPFVALLLLAFIGLRERRNE